MSAARVGPLASRPAPAKASPSAKLRMLERAGAICCFSWRALPAHRRPGATIVGRGQRVHKWLSGLQVLYGHGYVTEAPRGLETRLLRGSVGLAALGLQRGREAEQC